MALKPGGLKGGNGEAKVGIRNEKSSLTTKSGIDNWIFITFALCMFPHVAESVAQFNFSLLQLSKSEFLSAKKPSCSFRRADKLRADAQWAF